MQLKTVENLQKNIPIYFPDVNITRKMHNLSFFVPLVIQNDKTENICYKYLKIEQAGKRLHRIWNVLVQSRFFAIKNEQSQLMSTFIEYENLLYLKK